MPPRRSTTRSQKKKQIIPVDEDDVVGTSILKENQGPEAIQTQKPLLKDEANKHQTATPVPKTTVKCRRKEAITNDDTIQEPTLINKLLELSDDDDDLSEDESQFNESAINIRREPLAPITNINDKIHNGIPDEKTESYVNVNKIRSDGSNETSESYFHLSLNTTPCSNRPNNTYSSSRTRNIDNDDVFRSNTPRSNTPRSNTSHSNTSFFVNGNEIRSTLRKSYNPESAPPAPFRDMVNVHQICSWLCVNSDILLLAYNMYLSMQMPAANTFNIISPNFNSSTLASGVPQMPKQEDRQIFNCDLNSSEGIDWLRVANRNFSDFRNKFLDSVEEAIEIFKEKRARENKDTTARSLDEYEIISFVNENLTLDILQRWLSATNMAKLRDQNSLRVLQRFVQGSLIVNYDSRDTDATKSLDKITKKIAVPSQNGKNIASNLEL
ncbi:hypothetical protein RhiirA1_474510 [Rhizophagus irregularis]|uniref:Uncharacterized protein n=1 Tax=Rhizophagus irregularis TaxID=588596 RepID=A0A2N0QYG1_9GLOM|nr:hypothetical protein RhiirA1_474510 [Rhizophagus irregularis]